MEPNNICPVCGLPQDLCVCTDAQKTSSLIEIKVERRKYGKYWAVISGIDVDHQELKAILKSIKNKMACGGTIKGKTIEVLFGRGDRSSDLIKILVDLGFDKNSIHVTSA
jgi:translation initiation factor 1